MKIYFFVAFVLLSLVFFINYTFAAITIREGSCLNQEICLFSAWNLSNSHVAQCGYYTNYSICTDEVQSANLREAACIAGESKILSFYKPNNTHIEGANQGNYNYHICVTPNTYSCAIKNSCLSGQTCLGSVHKYTNTHFASCNFYSKQICCGIDSTPPTISNESINATSILPEQAVRLTANVTDDFAVSKVIATIQYPNGTLINHTMHLLSGDIYFLDFSGALENGIYSWTTTYANDTTNIFSTSSPNLKFRVLGLTYTIKGIALDFKTGEKISSGTAIAIIKETGYRNSSTIVDGIFTIYLRTSLDSNSTRFTIAIIANSTDGRFGYNYITMGYGPFVSQTQSCSVNQWHFKGKAIDATTGTTIDQGTVKISVTSEAGIYSNTTSFSNGVWDIYLSPCLISGELYTFQFTIAGGEKTIDMFMSKVAK